ncbi:hypothetical protein ACNKHM_04160 [Shigella sonnei]
MIEWIIRRSVANRFLVLMGALFLRSGAPGLSLTREWMRCRSSDVQVIIKTSYPGQAPQIVENQVTYPLTTTMLSVPGAKLCAVSRSWRLLCVCHFRRWHQSVLGALAGAGVPRPGTG